MTSFLKKEIKMVTATTFRKRVAWFVHHVEFTGNRIEIWRHGRRAAVLVSIPDLEVLEELERKSTRELELEMREKIEAWERVKRGEEYGGGI